MLRELFLLISLQLISARVLQLIPLDDLELISSDIFRSLAQLIGVSLVLAPRLEQSCSIMWQMHIYVTRLELFMCYLYHQ